jgi:hypothetical protein
MRLCVDDEVKIRLDRVRNLHFGSLGKPALGPGEDPADAEEYDETDPAFIKHPGRFAKKEVGVILEYDFTKKLDKNPDIKNGWIYFVEFQGNQHLRFWFLEDELDLI